MNISICTIYQNQPIQIDLEEKDTEPLTTLEWQELYQNAQANHIPYYWLSIVIIKNQDKYKGICYDGSALEKLKKNSQSLLDPMTRSSIETIRHLFFNCFKVIISKEINIPLDLKPLVQPGLSYFSFDHLEDFQIIKCAKAGLNSMMTSQSMLLLQERIGKIWFIIGCTLLKNQEDENSKLEAIRCFLSASRLGISQADEFLNKLK